MVNYRDTWEILAKRAVRQGQVDAETFMEWAAAAGMSPDAIADRLEEDLDNDGPIFGKYLRSLSGAASQSVLAAERNGKMAATFEDDDELAEFLSITDLEDAIDGDPDAIDILEEAAEDIEYIWVCTLVRTCDRCLPLHGQIRTMAEWEELGYLPETIHEGWDSACQCTLEIASQFRDRKELLAPLVRVPKKNAVGAKINKQTIRQVTQADMDKALAARDKARESAAGRRAMREAGKADARRSEDK